MKLQVFLMKENLEFGLFGVLLNQLKVNEGPCLSPHDLFNQKAQILTR
jgi:hypothetical protein